MEYSAVFALEVQLACVFVNEEFSPWQWQFFVAIILLVSNKTLLAVFSVPEDFQKCQAAINCSAQVINSISVVEVYSKWLIVVESLSRYTIIAVCVCLFVYFPHMLLDSTAVFLRQLFLKLISQSLQEKGAAEAG